ncbi:MAG: hypothetical protein HYX59_14290 [Elusimicrobia bacterium]|nr:hypothetical protein [Elusimicrobiota bacterium]
MLLARGADPGAKPLAARRGRGYTGGLSPLFLAVLLLTAAPRARAQTRAGVVEAGSVNAAPQTGSLGSSLPGGAPQLVTLSLAAPALALTPSGLVPSALAPTPALAAAPLAPSVLPASVIASVIAPVRPLEPKPAAAPLAEARRAAGDEAAAAGKAPLGELIDLTKRLFGESSVAGYKSAEYLRPGAPFRFAETDVFRYRSALNAPYAKSGAAEVRTLVDAAAGLARSAGISVELGERAGKPVLKIVPEEKGHKLNRLAWDMKNTYDSTMEYAPAKTNGAVAAYNSTDRVLYLPDFGRGDSFEAILHESRHALFTKRLRRGDLSVFHPSLVAYPGRSIAPNATSYDDYMSLEELSTHAKTLLHEIIRARRGDASAVSGARSDAHQFMDILRSAEINLFQLQRLLASGSLKSYRLTGETWPAVGGGHWEAINLPHAILALPVLDGPPPAKRSLWARLFKDEPEPPALAAARRHAAALRPLVKSLAAELETYLSALKGDAPDVEKARAAAARMVSLAEQADKRFAAAP